MQHPKSYRLYDAPPDSGDEYIYVLGLDPGVRTGIAVLSARRRLIGDSAGIDVQAFGMTLGFSGLPVAAQGKRTGVQKLFRSIEEAMEAWYECFFSEASLDFYRPATGLMHYVSEAMFAPPRRTQKSQTPQHREALARGAIADERLEGQLYQALSSYFPFASATRYRADEWRGSFNITGNRTRCKELARARVADFFGATDVTHDEAEAMLVPLHHLHVLGRQWRMEGKPLDVQEALQRGRAEHRSAKLKDLPEHVRAKMPQEGVIA